MKAWLIQIDAYDGATATTLRMASHDDDRLCHLDGQTWWPVIAKLPTLRYDFFDGSFDGGSITSPSGTLEANIEAIPSLPRLAIHDARIRIWGGELGDAFSSFVLTFDGRVKEQPSVDGGAMSISFAADDGWLDQPLLATYAGTGGAEGGPDLEGQVKPLALGAPRFAPATLIDAVNNIYQLSGYGPIGGVETAFERLNRFGPPSINTASFSALRAASVERGQWATCLAQGYVRLGAPPEGMLSFHLGGDVTGGWSRFAGDIIRRIATIAGRADRVSAADVAALNASRPWPLSILVTAQTTARELVQKIAMSVNAVAYVDWLGMLRLAPLGIGAPTMTLAADGSSLPPVADVRQVAVSAPFWKIAQGAAVTWQVHGLNDIAFNAPLNPRGPYDPVETYREGDMVTLPNGSQWLFIGTVPASGSEPSDENPVWFRLSDAITAGNITYEDGTPVEDLKPAEPGATQGGTIGVDIHIPEIPGIPAPPGLIRNDLLSLGDDGVLSYQPYPDNEDIKVALGQVAVPDVAGQLELQPDGSLQFVSPDGAVQVIGRIRLPDLGAASEASRRTLESAVDQLGAAVARVINEASQTRATFRDAGFYVDPATGQVRLYAIDQTRERISTAELRLSAAEASITLRATTSYVDGRIAQLVLDPSQFPVYEGIELRVSNVEVRLSGAEASIAQKATLIDLNLLGGRVSSAEQTIDALAGQIVLKVDRTEFNAVEARVSTAEQTIEALGDSASIVQALSAVRMLPAQAASAQENALRALLNGDLAARSQIAAIASARSELTVKINGDISAEARARSELAVRVGRAEALALTETQARVDGDQAITLMVTQLTSQFSDSTATFTAQIATLTTDTQALAARSDALEAGVGDNAAAIAAEQAARINADGVIRASASEAVSAARGLNARVDAVLDIITRDLLRGDARERELSGAIAAARQEITAKVNGDVEAIVSRISILLARMGRAEAAIVLEEVARATQDEAIVRQIQVLSATVGDANATFTQQISALATDALAATLRMDAMASAIGGNAAAINEEAFTRAQADGRIEAAAGQTVAAVRDVDGSAAKAAEQALRALLSGDAARRDAKSSIAAARQEVTAKINGDVEVLVQRISLLLARLGLAEASILDEQFARVTAQTALAAQILTLGARIDDANATITSDRVARVEGDAILAARIDTTEAANEDTAAAVRTEEQARIDADGALASQVTSLKAEKDTDVVNLVAGINAANQVRADDDAALAAAIQALRVEKNADDATIVAQANVDRQARVDGDTAVAASVDALRVEKDNGDAALAAQANLDRQARIDADGALAARQDTLSATVDGVTAELTEQAAVLVDLEGRTAIRFKIAATDPDGTTYIEIERQAGSGQIVLGGNTKILGNVVTPGSITAREIEANGVTRTFSAKNDAAIALGEMADTVTFNVVMARPGTIMVSSVQQLVFASGGAWATEMLVGSAILMSGSSNTDHQSNLIGEFYATEPGTYSVKLRASRTAGAVSINAGGAVMLVHRTYA